MASGPNNALPSIDWEAVRAEFPALENWTYLNTATYGGACSTQRHASKQSKKKYVKLNRSRNRMTIGIDSCIDVLTKKGISVPDPVRKNLEALTEIRDNAVHYINASPQLSKQVLEIGTACLRNFIKLGKLWVNLDLSSYSPYLMPVGFLPTEAATAMTISNKEQKVVNYLARMMKEGSSASD